MPHGIPYTGDGANPMPQLRKLLTEQGSTFSCAQLSRATGCSTAPDRTDRLRSNAFVHTPICCPSRSSYMTGKYLHNSGTFQNDIAHGCSDAKWVEGPEQRAFAAHVRTAPSSLGPRGATDEQRALAAQGGGLPHLLLRQVPQPVRPAGFSRLRQERRPGLRQ